MSGRIIFLNLFAGTLSSIMTLIASVSYAALIFSGSLSGNLSLGICSALVSAAVVGFIVAWRSSVPFLIAGPDANVSVVLAIMAGSVGTSLGSGAPAWTVSSTILALMALSTGLTGLFLYAVGRFHLGQWIRFVPYPVIGGFLAGTGWLLICGSFRVVADVPLTLGNILVLVRYENLIHWLPSMAFALLLVCILRCFNQFLVMPLLILAAIAVFLLAIHVSGIPTSQAFSERWLLAPIAGNALLESWNSFSSVHISWALILSEVPTLVALMIVSAIVILLNAASVEIATKTDLDLDGQLESTGLANLLVALIGGFVGCIALSRTLLNWKAGATKRLSGFVAALFSAGILVLGSSFLSYLPIPVLGSLLLYLGFSLVIEWIYDGWFRFSRFDYSLIVAIVVIIAVWGFVHGVAFGLVAACILFAFNYSRIGVIRHELWGGGYRSNVERSYRKERILREKADQIYIIRLQGYIFFGTAYPLLTYIRDRIKSHRPTVVRFLLLDFTYVSGLDSSSVLTFSKLKQICEANGVRLIFVHLSSQIKRLLQEGGCFEESEADQYSAENEASCHLFHDLDQALGWCEEQILKVESIKHETGAYRLEDLYVELFPENTSFFRLKEYLEKVEAPAGHVVFNQGDQPDSMYFVEVGSVTVWLELPNGETTRLRTMGMGTVVGEMGFYLGIPRSGTVVTEEPSVLYRLSKASYDKMNVEDHELAASVHQFMVRLLANRLVYANKQLANLIE